MLSLLVITGAIVAHPGMKGAVCRESTASGGACFLAACRGANGGRPQALVDLVACLEREGDEVALVEAYEIIGEFGDPKGADLAYAQAREHRGRLSPRQQLVFEVCEKSRSYGREPCYSNACERWKHLPMDEILSGRPHLELGRCLARAGTRLAPFKSRTAWAFTRAAEIGHEEVRRQSYAALGHIGFEKPSMVGDDVFTCGTIDRCPADGRPLFACKARSQEGGSGETIFKESLRIARSIDDAIPWHPPTDAAVSFELSNVEADDCRRRCAIDGDEASCAANCARRQGSFNRQCTVVAIDACTGRIGLSCRTEEFGKLSATVDELVIPPR